MSEEIKNNDDVQQAVNDALAEHKKKKKKKRLIIIAIIVGVIIVIGLVSGSGGSDKETTTNSNSTSTVSAEKEEETEGKIGNYICTIKSAAVCKNWEGKDSVKITYSFTNNAAEAESFDLALTDEVYQDGVGLESTFISSDDDDWGVDVKIKPGTTKEVSKVYKLRDKTTQLDVEISELFSLSDTKLTYTVNVK